MGGAVGLLVCAAVYGNLGEGASFLLIQSATEVNVAITQSEGVMKRESSYWEDTYGCMAEAYWHFFKQSSNPKMATQCERYSMSMPSPVTSRTPLISLRCFSDSPNW